MKLNAQRLLFVALSGMSMLANAATITDGFTFSVASSGNQVGTHFHSSTGGEFGNPAGKAEVGRFFNEEVRGLSEYNLTGLTAASQAFVTFNVYQLAGLFKGANDFPFTGTIAVDAYAGNNLENISDFHAASLGSVGSFSTAALTSTSVLSFDITSLYNAAISSGATSLGIRLMASPLNATGAVTFQNFRLTTDNQSTVSGNVPEPETWALVPAGLLVAGACLRGKRKATVSA